MIGVDEEGWIDIGHERNRTFARQALAVRDFIDQRPQRHQLAAGGRFRHAAELQ